MKNPYQNSVIPYLTEVVCASMIEQGFAVENMLVHQKGAFKKSYSTDIETISIAENEKNTANFIINRNGLYDVLPEGLFHQTKGSKAIRTTQNAVEEHRKFKEEEKLARKFFSPIENLIFRYRIFAELAERKAVESVQTGYSNQSLKNFWNIEATLTKAETERLLSLMPYSNFIKANKDAIQEALSFVLQKNVTVQEEWKIVEQDTLSCNDNILGINAVLGNKTNETMRVWKVTIQNINSSEMNSYVMGNDLWLLLNKFVELFFPIEVDATFEFEIDKKQVNSTPQVLGYGARL